MTDTLVDSAWVDWADAYRTQCDVEAILIGARQRNGPGGGQLTADETAHLRYGCDHLQTLGARLRIWARTDLPTRHRQRRHAAALRRVVSHG